MKTNQKGFSVVEVMLVIVVVVLIGAVGWLVYDRQNNKSNNDQPIASQSKTQATQQESNNTAKTPSTKSYTGKVAAFQYPKEWTVATETKPNVDEFVSLKTPNYATEEASIGGTQVKTGAVVHISMVKTAKSTIQTVDSPYARGTILQSKITSGEVQFKDVNIAGTKAVEFTWQYEGDGWRVVEFIQNGVFVHAELDTAGDETAQAEYPQFIALLNTIKL